MALMSIERKTRSKELNYEITNIDKDFGTGINIVMCGLPGTGKTTIAASFPNPLIINTDHGTGSLTNDFNKNSVKNGNIKQLYLKKGEEASRLTMQILFDIRNKTGKFTNWQPTTLIFDSFSALTEQLSEEILIYEPASKKGEERGDASLFLSDYKLIAERGTRIIDYATDICPFVIFLCNVEKYDDPMIQGKVEAPSTVGQKLPTKLGYGSTEIYYVASEKVGPNIQYFLTPEKTTKFHYSKTRHGVPSKIMNPTFDKLNVYYKWKK